MKSKKRILWFVVGIIIFCGVIGLLYGMFFNVEAKELAKKNLSEVRYNFFVGSDDISNVSLSSGYRENPYAIDGVHNDMVAFGVVVFRTSLSNVSEPTYEMTVDDENYQGIMERNPYDNTFVADIEKLVGDDSSVTFKVSIEDDVYTFTLTNISKDWAVGHTEAFEIGIDALNDYIQTLRKGNTFKGECYVKIVTDPNNILQIYYWYVAVVDTAGNTHAVVIDSSNGKVLSQS